MVVPFLGIASGVAVVALAPGPEGVSTDDKLAGAVVEEARNLAVLLPADLERLEAAAFLLVPPDRIVGQRAEVLAAFLDLEQLAAGLRLRYLVLELKEKVAQLIEGMDIAVDVPGF